MEDMMVETCLKTIFRLAPYDQTKDLTIVGETIDHQGRERFHRLAFRLHFNGPANRSKREWAHFRPFHHNLFVCFHLFFSSFYFLLFIKIGL
jgi:hypothetical protein